MALDGITVANIVSELQHALENGRINKITQPEADEILLTVKGSAGQQRLLLSASASLPLIYFTQKNKLSPMTAPNFCMLLRKHIGSGRFVRIWQPSLERVIHFEIEHYDEMGDLRRKDLILELMGKYSNLIFCDENGIILDSIKHIGAQTSSVREVLPGRTYFIPQTQEKLDPTKTSETEFLEHVFAKPMPVSKALYMTYTGISPVIAEELCYRSSVDSGQSAREIPEAEQRHLCRNFLELMEDVREERFAPCIIYDGEGVPVEFSSVPLTMYGDLTSSSFRTVSEVLETYYAQKNAVTRIRQKSADLRHVVSTLLERESRKLDLQRKQMKDTEKREKYRIYGELLHTYGYSVEPGADSVTVPNYYEDDREIRIPLDRTKSASENAKRYFDKYEKQKRTYEALTGQIEQTQGEVTQLESIRTFLDQAQTEADLAQIREELVQSEYIKKHGSDRISAGGSGRGKSAGQAGRGKGKQAASGKKGASRPERSHPYHFRTEDGYDIYVGKNNIQNDELTFRFANAGDWWFHAKKIPGSHVIVKRCTDAPLPDHVFELAASAAAYYSAGRDSDKVEIDYVQRKEVKKPGGAKPGFVVYYTNYSMVAKPDISSLISVE